MKIHLKAGTEKGLKYRLGQNTQLSENLLMKELLIIQGKNQYLLQESIDGKIKWI